MWDSMNQTAREQVDREVKDAVPAAALARYEEMLRRLAIECPEVAFWVNLTEHQATQRGIDHMRRSWPLGWQWRRGFLCPCRQAAGTAPGEARRPSDGLEEASPTCAASTYLNQGEKLGIDGETGRGTGR